MRLARQLKQAQERVRAAILELSWAEAHDSLRTVFGLRFPIASEAPAEQNEKVSTGPTIWTSKTKKVAALAPAGNVRSA